MPHVQGCHTDRALGAQVSRGASAIQEKLVPRSPEDLVLGKSAGCLEPTGAGGTVGEQVSWRPRKAGF